MDGRQGGGHVREGSSGMQGTERGMEGQEKLTWSMS